MTIRELIFLEKLEKLLLVPMLKSILVKIGIAIIVLAFADLVYINYLVLQNNKRDDAILEDQKVPRQIEQVNIPSTAPDPFSADEKSSLKTEPAAPTPTTIYQTEVKEKTVIQTAQKEIFIPVGSGSTFKSNYTDLPGVEVTIDSSKYSGIESVVFEASLWVQDGNGKMYAQLYNKTDGRPVWNSEISTNSASGVLTTSPKITLEAGLRTYKVQAKTNLTEYAAHVDNARVKITLK